MNFKKALIFTLAFMIFANTTVFSVAENTAKTSDTGTLSSNEKNIVKFLYDINIMDNEVNSFNSGDFISQKEVDFAYNTMLGLRDYKSTKSSGEYVASKDVVFMLLKLLGRDKIMEYQGGYQACAREIGLLKQLNLNFDEYMTKIDFCIMVNNALNIDIIKQDTVSTGKIDMSTVAGRTILTEYMMIYKGKGIVTAMSFATITGAAKLRDKTAKIGNEMYDVATDDVLDFLGQQVEFYYYQPEFEESKTIMSIKSSKVNNITKVNAYDIDSLSNNQKFKYNNGGKKVEEISIDPLAYVLYNNEFLQKAANVPPETFRPKLGDVTLIDNNNDDNIDIVFINEGKIGIIGSVNTQIMSFYINMLEKNVPVDEDISVKIYRDGNYIKYYSLKVGDVAEVYESKSGNHMEIQVLSRTFSGVIDAVSTDEISIAASSEGEDVINSYPISEGFVSVTKTPLQSGNKGTFTINERGVLVCYNNNLSSVRKYAFPVAMREVNSINGNWQIKMFNENNRFAVYDCGKKITVDGKRNQTASMLYTSLKKAKDIGEISSLIKYKTNAKNEIVWVDTILENEDILDADRLTLKTFSGLTYMSNSQMLESNQSSDKVVLDGSTIVFKIPNDITDEETFQVSNVGILTGNTFQCFDINNDIVSSILLPYVGANAVPTPNNGSSPLSIVMGESKVISEDGIEKRKVTVFKEKQEAWFYIDDDETKMFEQVDTTTTNGNITTKSKIVPTLNKGDLIYYDLIDTNAKAIKRINMEKLGTPGAVKFLQDPRGGGERAYGQLINMDNGLVKIKTGVEKFDEVIYSLRNVNPIVYVYNARQNTVITTDKSALYLSNPYQNVFIRVKSAKVTEIVIFSEGV